MVDAMMPQRPRLQRVPLPTRSNFQDVYGKRFNLLVGLEYVGKVGDLALWRWRCDCGQVTTLLSHKVKSGRVKSCGCLRKGTGLASERLYGVWIQMNARCYNNRDKRYKDYGGRGIQVHQPWRKDLHGLDGYRAFKRDFGERSSNDMSVDRVDNDGNYDPDNLKWSTDEQQQNNTRRTIKIFYDGFMQPLSVVCRSCGISVRAVRVMACRRKITHQEAFNLFVGRKMQESSGKTLS